MSIPAITDLLQAGVHFGHHRSRWHPKMKPYIFTERGGVYILDLEQTVIKLEEACQFVTEIAARNGTVLFVGTKKQGQEIIEKYARDCGMPFIVERWVGGLFTNFANVSKLIRKYKDLQEQTESGELKKYTKKEQVEFAKEIEKLKKLVGGLEGMDKIPDAIFVLDVKREKTAVTEATKRKVPIIGFADANINPDSLTYPIPANDDAINSIEIITRTIAEAIKEGKTKIATPTPTN
ncbi:MAG: 30S ribosomal protein S2 [Candidatus Buchananbacteria bacterium]|nr:30S ribosomal protein S2 [Candidatus Buchananbacteria bacterium]